MQCRRSVFMDVLCTAASGGTHQSGRTTSDKGGDLFAGNWETVGTRTQCGRSRAHRGLECRCWNSQPYALTFAPSRVNTPAVAHVGESGRPAQQIDYRRRAAQKSNGVYGQPPLQGPPNCVVTSPCCAGTWTAWLDGPGQASKFIAMSLWHRVGRRDPFGPVPSTSRD
ncbi:hypothetical protein CSUB01_04841 [Colletotrichum sublineola]|uniref:Uncharacterized protein n=1 Tax=Colletotrichum sublineola TaxID=1173701 RepID=A0A066X0H8_COLSU|nr:hypothetical protein CSUB01_04841 [Colletotrichum sublineola]